MAYHRSLDLMVLAVQATINNKPQLAANALDRAAKDPQIAKVIASVIRANPKSSAKATASGDGVEVWSSMLRERAAKRAKAKRAAARVAASAQDGSIRARLLQEIAEAGEEPAVDADEVGEEERIEVESSTILASDDELLEEFDEIASITELAADEGDDDEEEEEESEEEEEEEEDAKSKSKSKSKKKASVASTSSRTARALANLRRRHGA